MQQNFKSLEKKPFEKNQQVEEEKLQNENIEKNCVEILTKLDNITEKVPPTEIITEILKESVNKIDNIIELNSPKNEILKNKIKRMEFIC